MADPTAGDTLPEPEISTAVSPSGAHEHVLEATGDISLLLSQGSQLQHAATTHGIHNVFDDGGYKELLLLTLFNLRKLDRGGDDAEDIHGRHYEIKTVARVSYSGRRKTNLAVTTEHTLTLNNLARYRSAFLWIIAVFDQSMPEVIYEIEPARLEPYFSIWEVKLASQGLAIGGAPNHLNNPKIPLSFVARHGVRIWPPHRQPALADDFLRWD
jgi:hypothetical protein